MNFRVYIFILLLLKVFCSYGRRCKLYKCSINYSRSLEEGKVSIGSNGVFCKVINSYLSCLNRNLPYCKGNLQFHTLKTILTKQYDYFNCKNVTENTVNSYCLGHLNKLSRIKKPKYYCAIFGSNHIQTFSGQTFHCPFSIGTYTAISNKHFLIQITFDHPNYNDNKLVIIKKISIIINKVNNCTDQKLYTIINNQKELLTSFDDGTSYSGREVKPFVEVKRLNSTTVKILLNHILAEINLYKFNNTLSLSILTSNIKNNFNKKIINKNSWNNLCYHGCMGNFSINNLFKLNNTVESLEKFQDCYSIKAKNNISYATDICNSKNLKNFYNESCIIDMMYYGNLSLIEANHPLQEGAKFHNNKNNLTRQKIKLSHKLYQNFTCTYSQNLQLSNTSPSVYVKNNYTNLILLFTQIFILNFL